MVVLRLPVVTSGTMTEDPPMVGTTSMTGTTTTRTLSSVGSTPTMAAATATESSSNNLRFQNSNDMETANNKTERNMIDATTSTLLDT